MNLWLEVDHDGKIRHRQVELPALPPIGATIFMQPETSLTVERCEVWQHEGEIVLVCRVDAGGAFEIDGWKPGHAADQF